MTTRTTMATSMQPVASSLMTRLWNSVEELALAAPASPRPPRRRRGPCRGGGGCRARRAGPARRRRCRRGAGALRCGDGRADDDVAEQQRQVGRLGGRDSPGPVPPESGERPLSGGSSSIGKASTSVGPSLPRKRLLRSAMASSSTNSTDSSASPRTPSASSTSLGEPHPARCVSTRMRRSARRRRTTGDCHQVHASDLRRARRS